VLKQPKSQITNPPAYIAQPMLLAFAILRQPDFDAIVATV
jgi:hypothetical protein